MEDTYRGNDEKTGGGKTEKKKDVNGGFTAVVRSLKYPRNTHSCKYSV